MMKMTMKRKMTIIFKRINLGGNFGAIFLKYGAIFSISHAKMQKIKLLESAYFQGVCFVLGVFLKVPAAGLELYE